MNKILHRKECGIWSEIFSPTIFKLDIIDSFKYRKKQALISLFITLTAFSLVGWIFSIDVINLNWSNNQVVFLTLLYLPLLVILLFCFRAFAIYNCSVWRADEEDDSFIEIWKKSEERGFITKKQARASLIFKTGRILFWFYYFYWVYRLWAIAH